MISSASRWRQAATLLTNNVGIAGGLSWELKRNDIILFDKQGELKYGLDWPDAQGRFVSEGDFVSWLATHRQQGRYRWFC
nr:4-amino-4-deoxy-L-arabinose transferase [Raoultella sp. NCTC 9187]